MKDLIKEVYKSIPFKKEAFSLVKKFYHPKEEIYKHLHFKGIFDVQVEKDISFKVKHYGFLIENELFWEGLEGGLESVSYAFWKQLAKTSQTIFDVGANTGVYSLLAESVNPKAKIYAFEPVKRVFQKLEENKKLNNFSFFCFEKALSNADGEATIFDTDDEHVYSVTVNQNSRSNNIKVIPTKIEIARLDTFIKEFRIENIDLIKLDVEGHEPEVLEGMGEYLNRFKPTILIEILEDSVGREVEKLVKGNNYLYFNIDDRAKNLRRVEHINKSDFWNYLLCSAEKAKELNLI